MAPSHLTGREAQNGHHRREAAVSTAHRQKYHRLMTVEDGGECFGTVQSKRVQTLRTKRCDLGTTNQRAVCTFLRGDDQRRRGLWPPCGVQRPSVLLQLDCPLAQSARQYKVLIHAACTRLTVGLPLYLPVPRIGRRLRMDCGRSWPHWFGLWQRSGAGWDARVTQRCAPYMPISSISKIHDNPVFPCKGLVGRHQVAPGHTPHTTEELQEQGSGLQCVL